MISKEGTGFYDSKIRNSHPISSLNSISIRLGGMRNEDERVI